MGVSVYVDAVTLCYGVVLIAGVERLTDAGYEPRSSLG
jgi:hypothetical protein